MLSVQEPSNSTELDCSIDELSGGAGALLGMSIDRRLDLIHRCIDGVGEVARDWVEAACDAKSIPARSPARTEEITAGPLATVRFLQLLKQTLLDVQSTGKPILPGSVIHAHGQCRVQVFPTPLLYDSLLFRPMTAETWLDPVVVPDSVSAEGTARLLGKNRQPEVIVVLGAGNVSSIPATDALTKIFIENSAVSLKMNPVNDYLGPFFQVALQPLVDEHVLRIAYGGIDAGRHLVEHPSTTGVHITGSIHSHDAIVWGAGDDREQRRRDNQPVLRKAITSELGNVTPWAIIPGAYSDKELGAQAEIVATSIVNNVSFNCIATKLILTCRSWSQRDRFFELLDNILESTPVRNAYYPGAAARFQQFAGAEPDDPDCLPWTLLRDIDPDTAPHLLREESFTCVCGELVIDADSDVEFLQQATDVMNDQVWGTLAATLTSPSDFQRNRATELDECLRRLRFGTIGINQWPALSFALMSPPWGGHPSSDLSDAQSGIGFVHNTYLLDRPEKTILRAPLQTSPKPIWDSTHRHPERVVWNLLKLYQSPSAMKLPRLFWNSVTG